MLSFYTFVKNFPAHPLFEENSVLKKNILSITENETYQILFSHFLHKNTKKQSFPIRMTALFIICLIELWQFQPIV